LNARFSYNKRFNVTKDRAAGGSWTRRLHPDYTLTFWPDGHSEEEAERNELLVHVHLDAKYRVEDLEGLFGMEGADDADDETDGNYKRQDLLKMHAYRDAIKRSQGAYVLYPGRSNKLVQFSGFHEILPGLGAFGVAPDERGRAQGMGELSRFLDETLAHLCNRTTAQERSSFHVLQAYRSKFDIGPYTALPLPENDVFGKNLRGLPPAEHMVMVAWNYEEEQLEWTKANNIGVVRLGSLSGAWRVQAELSGVRHLLLHGRVGVPSGGLWRLRAPGYRILTDVDLAATGYPVPVFGEIYAIFDVASEPDWPSVVWSPKMLIRAIRNFESSIDPTLARNVGRQSRFPRILPLLGLLKALPPP